MCCNAPSPPDYSGVAASNEAAAKLANETAAQDLAFRREVWQASLPREQQLYDLANSIVQNQVGLGNRAQDIAEKQWAMGEKVGQQQYDIAEENRQRATEQWQNYLQTYLPTERQVAAEAYGSQYLNANEVSQLNNILSGRSGLSEEEAQSELNRLTRLSENRAGASAETQARADISNVYGQAQRGLTRYGGDPNRLAAQAAQLANQQALAQVGAANTARENVRTRGVGLRSGVANFGRNMPNTAAQAFGLAEQAGLNAATAPGAGNAAAGLALNAGNSAVANQGTAFGAGLPYSQFVAGGYGSGLTAAGIQQQGALGYGNLMNQGYATAGNLAAGNAAGLGQGIGSLAGLGAAYFI